MGAVEERHEINLRQRWRSAAAIEPMNGDAPSQDDPLAQKKRRANRIIAGCVLVLLLLLLLFFLWPVKSASGRGIKTFVFGNYWGGAGGSGGGSGKEFAAQTGS